MLLSRTFSAVRGRSLVSEKILGNKILVSEKMLRNKLLVSEVIPDNKILCPSMSVGTIFMQTASKQQQPVSRSRAFYCTNHMFHHKTLNFNITCILHLPVTSSIKTARYQFNSKIENLVQHLRRLKCAERCQEYQHSLYCARFIKSSKIVE